MGGGGVDDTPSWLRMSMECTAILINLNITSATRNLFLKVISHLPEAPLIVSKHKQGPPLPGQTEL